MTTRFDPNLLDFIEPLLELPPTAHGIYIALLDAYVRTGGEVEVFVEEHGEDRGCRMSIRPSNVGGQLVIDFFPDGRIRDVVFENE